MAVRRVNASQDAGKSRYPVKWIRKKNEFYECKSAESAHVANSLIMAGQGGVCGRGDIIAGKQVRD